MPAYRTPTGELLRSLRPATYRQIVDLLAEPREHVSYREIARVCRCSGNTIKAVERAEAESIVGPQRENSTEGDTRCGARMVLYAKRSTNNLT